MKKNNIGIIVFIIIFLITFFAPAISTSIEEGESLSPNDYCRITDMDYKAVVVDEPGCEGKIVVTERITFDVHAASEDNPFWELWRDLCEDWIDGVRVHYKVNSVKQVLPDGTKVLWEESPKLYWDDSDYESWNTTYGPGKWYHSEGPYNEYTEDYECVFFYVDGLYREKVTFEIEYEMYNAALRYGDCSDLYIAMYSGDTTKYLQSLNAEILIPNKDMPQKGNYKVTTYGTNAGSFPVEESATKNEGYYTFSFNLSEEELQFKKYNEYIEFDLVSFGEDKHIFAEHASENYYSNEPALEEILEEQEYYANAPERYRQLKIKIFTGCAIVAGFVLLIVFLKIRKLKSRYPNSGKGKTNDTFRDIPSDLDPKFAKELVFCKDKKKPDDSGVYSSLLLSLARKKYIDLHELSYSDVMIIVNEPRTYQPTPPVQEVEIINNINNKEENGGYDSNGIYHSYNVSNNENNDGDNNERRAYESPSDSLGRRYESFGTSYDDGDTVRPSGSRTYESFDTLYTRPSYKPTYDTQPTNDEPAFNRQEEYNESQYGTEYNDASTVFESLEPLTICEKHYLNLIKRHAKDGSIRMSTLQSRVSVDYDNTRDFSKNIEKSTVDTGINYGYIQRANWLAPQKELKGFAKTAFTFGVIFGLINLFIMNTQIGIAFGGFILLSIVCLIAGFYLKSQSHKYALLTDFGENEYKKWRGLYNFLKSDTLINERTVVELPLWEKYLVYATAFGISEKVIKAIQIRCPEFSTADSIINSNYCRSGRIRSSGRHFHSSVRSGSHGGYHGGGGSFGYGGGGRGGGGGGGGH